MASAEAKLGKSLDALIEENRAKAGGSGRARASSGGARKPAGGVGVRVAKSSTAVGGKRERGGIRERLKQMTGRGLGNSLPIPGLARAAGGAEAGVVVGNKRYTPALGVVGGGVGKRQTRGGARRTGGGGGAAASFDHDDRVDPAHGDDYGMGGRLQGSGGPGGMWKHDMYDGREQAAPRQPRLLQAASARGGTLVSVQNLDFQVTKQDLLELFTPIGKVLSATIDYDQSDRPKGTAQVVFADLMAAEQALTTYNGVKLDGRVLRLQLGGAAPIVLSSGRRLELPGSAAPARMGAGRALQAVQALPPAVSRSPRFGPGVPRAGRGGGGRLRSVVGGMRTGQELDADLSNYMQE